MWPAHPAEYKHPVPETRGPRCLPDATTPRAAHRGRPRETVNRPKTRLRRRGPPSPGACPAGRAPSGAHLAARAGNEVPRSLHPPIAGAGFCYRLELSRLSRVVGIARFHYSPRLAAFFPHRNKGESAPLRGRAARPAPGAPGPGPRGYAASSAGWREPVLSPSKGSCFWTRVPQVPVSRFLHNERVGGPGPGRSERSHSSWVPQVPSIWAPGRALILAIRFWRVAQAPGDVSAATQVGWRVAQVPGVVSTATQVGCPRCLAFGHLGER